MYGKRFLLLTSIVCFVYGSITVHAETKTIEKPSGDTINLIEMSNELNETYSIDNDTYFFSFNGTTIRIEKDNPIMMVNNEQQLIETETKEDIVLPKYSTLTVEKDNVEFNYEKFLEITGYSTNENGIEITLDDSYKIPEQTETVKNLDVSYIETHLNELGYDKVNTHTYAYKIYGTTYHEIQFTNNGIEVRINRGKEYENNYSINNLVIETLFKCVDNEQASDLYKLYLDEKNIEKNMDNMKLNMTFTDTLVTVSMQLK